MARPKIAVTISTDEHHDRTKELKLKEAYFLSIQNAGGEPVVFPMDSSVEKVPEIIAEFQGVLLTGGGDFDPVLFNGIPHHNVYGIDRHRDELEIALVNYCSSNNLPLLGICRGMQAINVALGGSLHTDIADQLPGALRHSCYPAYPRDYFAHTVDIHINTHLTAITNQTQLKVNSMHHQGIKDIAQELTVSAVSPDGLIEGVELMFHPFFLGVQWHPECLPDSPSDRAIFSALVRAASPKE
jgi:putative glutamine amidotransferase